MSQSERGEQGGTARRLRRRSPPKLAGVAAGLGHYVGIDPLLFRLLFVGFTIFFGGSGIALYLAGWLLLPTGDDPDPRPLRLTGGVRLVAGCIALAVGAVVAANSATPVLGAAVIVPVGMIIAGIALLDQRPERSAVDAPSNPRARGAWPPPGEPPADPPLVSGPTLSSDPPPLPPDPTAPFYGPPVTAPLPGPPAGPGDGGAPGRPWAMPRTGDVEAGPQGPPVTTITLAAVAVVTGGLLVIGSIGGVDVGLSLILGAVITTLGAGIVASAMVGRAISLHVLAVAALALLPVAPLAEGTLAGGIGTRDVRVGSVDGLDDSYAIGMGELMLDLSGLEPVGEERVEVDVGAGYAQIIVPADVRVEVRATSRAGYVDALGLREEGIGNEVFHVSEPDGAAGGSLTIIAEVTFGYVEVSRG